MLNWLEIIKQSPPILAGVLFAMLVTSQLGRVEAWRLLNVYGKQKDASNVEFRQYMRVLPYLVLSSSHFLLGWFQKLLSTLLALSMGMALTLPWTFDAIVAKVYAINGIGALYAQGGIRPDILAFQQAFMPYAIALVISIIVWVAGLAMKDRGKFRWILILIGFVAMLAALALSMQLLFPLLKENGSALLNASTRAGNQFSVFSQFLLGPVYALILVTMMAIILVPLYVLVFVIVIFKKAFFRNKNEEGLSFFEYIFSWTRKVTMFIGFGLGAGAAISFMLTISALMMGGLSMHETGMQRLVVTKQLLFYNAISDGITLTMTIWAIGFGVWLTKDSLKAFLVSVGKDASHKKAVKDWLKGINPFFVGSIIIVILADLVIAAIIAVASLYLALRGGGWQISFAEALHILFGINQSGTAIQMDERFWVMHTTFLPTLIYMGFVIVALVLMFFWNKYIADGLDWFSKLSWVTKLLKLPMNLFIKYCLPAIALTLGTLYVPNISKEQYVVIVRDQILPPLLAIVQFITPG